MKFKVGDEVKVIHGEIGHNAGTIGTIQQADAHDVENLPYKVEANGYFFWQSEADLILVKGGKMPRKKELKNRFVLVSDSEDCLTTDKIFDSKNEAKQFVKDTEADPILCKIVPVCKLVVETKAVEKKL